MRLLLALTSTLMLSACIPNTLYSPTPVFTAADETGAPALRPGVWRADGKADCRVDERRPLERWPECAEGFVVEPGRQLILVPQPQAGGGLSYEWLAEAAVLAGGEPRVLQTGCGGLAREDGAAPSEEAARFNFCFQAVRATRTAPDGSVVELVGWPILCGPPPKDAKKAVTDAPFEGIRLDGEFCTAASPAAVRGAAAASEALPEAASHRMRAHWVRDGYH